MESNKGVLEKWFHLKENHTDAKTEVIAGITTFMTMAYILAVNPNVLGASGMDSGAVFTATALAAMVGTLMMALFANYPFVLAPGMGLNAYFAYTVVLQMGYSWEMALAAVFVEGVVFIVLSVTNVREAIFNSIPMNLKYAVSVGIGLFIAFIGFQNAKIVVDSATLVSLYSFKGAVAAGTFSSEGITVVLAMIGILITGILVVKNVRGNILWGILITWALGMICQLTGLSGHADKNGLLAWINAFSPKPKRVFIVHGDDEVENIFAQTLTDEGFTACAPYNGAQWVIGAEGAVCVQEGTRVRVERRPSEGASRAATVFQRLVSAGKRLLRVIEHNEGGANKDLAKFADQINALCDKWDR